MRRGDRALVRIDGPRVHHHLHHAEHRHRQPHQQPAPGHAVPAVRRGELERPRGVADIGERAEQPRDGQRAPAPAYQHAARGQIGDRGLDAGQLRQLLFDQPGAGGAADVLGRQRDFEAVLRSFLRPRLTRAIKPPHEARAQLVGVVGLPDRLQPRPCRRVERPAEAEFAGIQMCETGLVQCLRQRQAAGAAEVARSPADLRAQHVRRGAGRQPAVEARGGVRVGVRSGVRLHGGPGWLGVGRRGESDRHRGPGCPIDSRDRRRAAV